MSRTAQIPMVPDICMYIPICNVQYVHLSHLTITLVTCSSQTSGTFITRAARFVEQGLPK